MRNTYLEFLDGDGEPTWLAISLWDHAAHLYCCITDYDVAEGVVGFDA